jgi:hypothetical protein
MTQDTSIPSVPPDRPDESPGEANSRVADERAAMGQDPEGSDGDQAPVDAPQSSADADRLAAEGDSEASDE